MKDSWKEGIEKRYGSLEKYQAVAREFNSQRKVKVVPEGFKDKELASRAGKIGAAKRWKLHYERLKSEPRG